ncbi:hypothetical protein HG536_0F04660 [Torulaspora globosa]|uniref:Uncharacterized protein n=1 Tax=Torulaspora globosa TaxID=48254 RepID=A0A7G3ZKV4_9SACH|nr:uncharacterized protein HG536_0F04660 [Torulaspora globosa]QLL34140.1 hypothetical protein HG536_0F04660 [Torulaspora globosa]
MEESPSKDLAADLQSFHISSPRSGRKPASTDAAAPDMIGRNVMKQYLPNNEFADSKFVSYVGESESKSYIKRLGDWSMNYGTVQQRSKSPVKKDNELPQFKQYLNFSLPQKNSKQELSRDPESELILTASLNDISGIPTNTFKRHDHQMKRQQLTNTESLSQDVGEQEDEEEKGATDLDDVDPALEARGVFDNILKTQKSNYDFQQGRDEPLAGSRNRYESDGTSSYLGETPSSLSPNFEPYPEKPAGIKLITPEEMGLVFDNVNGVWYKPPAKNQDISSSRTIDNADSTMSNISKDQHGIEGIIAASAMMKFGRSKKEARPSLPENTDTVEERYEIEDDTPLDLPQISPEYLLQANAMKNDKKSSGNNATQNMIANVTTVSQVETSFQQSKRELISIITDILPAHKISWSRVRRIDLQDKQLSQVIGLNEILPHLTDCDLSDNDLRGLLGVPTGVLRLSCRNNRISSAYLSLDTLPHLETIDLSHNSIGHNVNILSSSIHLRHVNLSHNKIRSLSGGLGPSRIIKLDLSNNDISGAIDFAQLVRHDRHDEGERGWLSLEELNLSNNKITRLRNVRCLKSLRVLKIDGNPIKELIETAGAIETTVRSNLRTLSITNTQNALTRLGTLIASTTFRDEIPYRRLRILRTDSFSRFCRIRSMPRTLEELSIQGGKVEALPSWSIFPSSLRKLSLKSLQDLREIPHTLAYQLPSLQELDLSRNQLNSCYKLVRALPTSCLVKLSIKDNPLSSSEKDKRDLTKVIGMVCPRLTSFEL